ncbi:MAG TPA: acyl-CoA desaturase [Acidocella sp.]|nr:MAG: hypothetical protein B7Z77_01095 [Acidocella sp. 20-58-15]HQT38127.1 acyl-CoA desaturase [Acidocella sp.]
MNEISKAARVGSELSVGRWSWRSLATSNAAVFPYFQAIGTICVAVALFMNQNWRWWLLAGVMYFLMSCLGLTVTYHRFLTHRSFTMAKWKEYLFCCFGAVGCTGSPLGWVVVHRVHHAHADKPGDPHSPSLRHLEILAGRLDFSFNKWTMRRMVNEPFHRLLHEYYFLWLLAWAVILFVISPKILLFGLLVPAGILLNVSSLSNYLNHKIGYRNFDTDDDSTNNVLIALLAWGEGWHNNHHRNPRAWNLQSRWWELDPTAWVIRCVRDR